MYAKVIVDISHSDVDKVFEYRIPSNFQVELGSRVIVPFGGRTIEGIVIEKSPTSEFSEEKIKDIQSVLENTPALTEETLSLANYVSESCYVTKAQALRLFLPSEMRKGKVKEQFITEYKIKQEVNMALSFFGLRYEINRNAEIAEIVEEPARNQTDYT